MVVQHPGHGAHALPSEATLEPGPTPGKELGREYVLKLRKEV